MLYRIADHLRSADGSENAEGIEERMRGGEEGWKGFATRGGFPAIPDAACSNMRRPNIAEIMLKAPGAKANEPESLMQVKKDVQGRGYFGIIRRRSPPLMRGDFRLTW
jgi:hypothetical protein